MFTSCYFESPLSRLLIGSNIVTDGCEGSEESGNSRTDAIA